MLTDVDASLADWLSARLPPGTKIGFEPPAGVAAQGTSRHRSALLNLFLHEVCEDAGGMAAGGLRVRGDNGRVTGAVIPTPRYRVSYLVTAWAADVFAEHRLLSAVLTAHAEQQLLPRQHLQGSLRLVDMPIPVQIGPGNDGAGQHGVWQAAGIPIRSSVNLTVTAPVLPYQVDVAAPAETVELQMRTHPDPAAVAAPALPARRWKRTTITEP